MVEATYEQLQQQIADRRQQIEQQRQAALEAERQRKETEEAPRKAISAAEQELRQLEYQAAETGWRELADKSAALMSEQRLKAQEAITALERADFHAARALMKQAADLGQQAGQYRAQADALIKPWRQRAFADAWNRHVDGQRDELTLARAAEATPEVRNFDNRHALPEPPPVYELVGEWVTAVPEGLDRQIRRGLCFAAFGCFGDHLDAILARFTNLPVIGI